MRTLTLRTAPGEERTSCLDASALLICGVLPGSCRHEAEILGQIPDSARVLLVVVKVAGGPPGCSLLHFFQREPVLAVDVGDIAGDAAMVVIMPSRVVHSV